MSEALHTQHILIDAANPDPAAIAEAADVLRAGKLVAFPTETVYGLGANAFDQAAVERIFAAKQRPFSDPLIVHLSSLEHLSAVAKNVPELAYSLARQFWPGPLTLVLPRGERVPAMVSAGLDTVAVRVPDHPVAFALLQAANLPIAAPSANRFTRPSPTTAQHVLDDLGGRIDLVLDGGPTPIGLESTVLSLVAETPEVLRPGGVPIEQLQALLPDLVYRPRYLPTHDEAQAAPGMLLKHYAPNVPVVLFEGASADPQLHMQATIAARIKNGQRVGVLAVDEEAERFRSQGAVVATLGSQSNLAQISARLFAGLRELEHAKVDVILVRSVEHHGLGLAIWDRLLRATEGRVARASTD